MEYNKISQLLEKSHVVTRGNNRYKTMQDINTFCISIKLVTLAQTDFGESSQESNFTQIWSKMALCKLS